MSSRLFGFLVSWLPGLFSWLSGFPASWLPWLLFGHGEPQHALRRLGLHAGLALRSMEGDLVLRACGNRHGGKKLRFLSGVKDNLHFQVI